MQWESDATRHKKIYFSPITMGLDHFGPLNFDIFIGDKTQLLIDPNILIGLGLRKFETGSIQNHRVLIESKPGYSYVQQSAGLHIVLNRSKVGPIWVLNQSKNHPNSVRSGHRPILSNAQILNSNNYSRQPMITFWSWVHLNRFQILFISINLLFFSLDLIILSNL